ncbi:MAG: response regulator [Nitrosopumilus sp.]|nr:response regulator [Nitrosopumilus sp.]
MKVLHIDDSPEICGLYSDMFTADNHSVRSIDDGKKGLDLVVKNDYDLILLDMCMPKYSGLDFLRDLKILRPSELKKVVVVSVLKFDEKHIKEFLEFGIHSVEEKPSDLEGICAIQKKISLK